MAEPLDEDTTKALLIWIDQIELSRPKKNINRDFADGVLVAELIAVSCFRNLPPTLIVSISSRTESKSTIIKRLAHVKEN